MSVHALLSHVWFKCMKTAFIPHHNNDLAKLMTILDGTRTSLHLIEVEDEFSDLPLALRKIAKRTKNAFMCPNLFAIIIDKSNKMRN